MPRQLCHEWTRTDGKPPARDRRIGDCRRAAGGRIMAGARTDRGQQDAGLPDVGSHQLQRDSAAVTNVVYSRYITVDGLSRKRHKPGSAQNAWSDIQYKGNAMDFEFVDVKRHDRITVVTLNRPGVMNALHKPAHFELHEVFNAFAADPDQWVAIVTGAGDRAFCAGNDLKWQAAGGERGWSSSGFAGLTSRFACGHPTT